ncbi:acetyltransferase [Paenibacillus ihumii]|uniref:acetyltransferase n=1 Tax=Paenibacillus ihumii TaxID=687436 RepID=UPI000938A02F|nr:acetyltransferase [Paenibacillus ihumii]
MKDAKLIIWGCGGMGREIAALCEILGRDVIGFLDERIEMHGQIIDDVPVLGDIADIAKYRHEAEIICSGVGEPALKRKFVRKTREAGLQIASPLIHPSVHVPPSSRIGVSSILCAGTIISINVNIGNFVIVNTNVTLAHDVSISDYCTISPGVNISGNVTVEEGAFIGTGSAIREKVSIGAWSMVGGGSFVKNDVPPQVLYAGVPAVYKKTRAWPHNESPCDKQ